MNSGKEAADKQWKDRHADGPISAKKPKSVKERQKKEEAAQGECRKSEQNRDDT